MKGHGSKLPRKQEAAISALVRHGTLGEAATACGVNESTLRRWLKLETFQTAYRDARRQLVQSAIVATQRAAQQAVKTLQMVQTDPLASPSARVTAAKTVLDLALRAVEIEHIEERLCTLEAITGHKHAKHQHATRTT